MQYRPGDIHSESRATFVSIDSKGLLFRLPDGEYCREIDLEQFELENVEAEFKTAENEDEDEDE